MESSIYDKIYENIWEEVSKKFDEKVEDGFKPTNTKRNFSGFSLHFDYDVAANDIFKSSCKKFLEEKIEKTQLPIFAAKYENEYPYIQIDINFAAKRINKFSFEYRGEIIVSEYFLHFKKRSAKYMKEDWDFPSSVITEVNKDFIRFDSPYNDGIYTLSFIYIPSGCKKLVYNEQTDFLLVSYICKHYNESDRREILETYFKTKFSEKDILRFLI